MSDRIETRLRELGICLPASSNPAAQYANYVIVNGLMFVSGKGPAGNPKGKLGSTYTTQEGYEFARLTGIEILAVLKEALGSLDRVKRVVKLQGFINAESYFEEHHKVLDGASNLMYEVFGDKGLHARSVFGAASIRNNLPVVVDSIFEVEEIRTL